MSRDYTKLDAWTKARELVNFVYSISKGFPKEELLGLPAKLGDVQFLFLPILLREVDGFQERKAFISIT